jgi:hypothetical protein
VRMKPASAMKRLFIIGVAALVLAGTAQAASAWKSNTFRNAAGVTCHYWGGNGVLMFATDNGYAVKMNPARADITRYLTPYDRARSKLAPYSASPLLLGQKWRSADGFASCSSRARGAIDCTAGAHGFSISRKGLVGW